MSQRRGYTAGKAWSIAMKPNGSQSIANLEIGGYAVPLERSTKIAPPSRTVPIRAQIPSGKVWILPGQSHGFWVIAKAPSKVTGANVPHSARGARVVKDLELWGVDRKLVSEVRDAFARGDHKVAMALAKDLGWNRAAKRWRAP